MEYALPFGVVGVCLASGGAYVVEGYWAGALAWLLLGLCWMSFHALQRSWRRSGYHAARAEMLAALSEAHQRNFSENEYWATEYQRVLRSFPR